MSRDFILGVIAGCGAMAFVFLMLLLGAGGS